VATTQLNSIVRSTSKLEPLKIRGIPTWGRHNASGTPNARL